MSVSTSETLTRCPRPAPSGSSVGVEDSSFGGVASGMGFSLFYSVKIHFLQREPGAWGRCPLRGQERMGILVPRSCMMVVERVFPRVSLGCWCRQAETPDVHPLARECELHACIAQHIFSPVDTHMCTPSHK